MKAKLEQIALSTLRALGASLIVLIPALWVAPDVSHAVAIATAALFGVLTGGFKALQLLIPDLTFAKIVRQPYAAYLDSFSRAFLGSLVGAIIAWLSFPDLHTWQKVGLAALVGAVTAGIRALQGLVTKGESPLPASGK